MEGQVIALEKIKFAVLIPSYKPDARLPELVRQLLSSGRLTVIVVDDGSGEDYRAIFEELQQLPDCQVLRHAVNMGKGRALKTGFNFFCLNSQDAPGLVTADADGQHTPTDILKLCDCLAKYPRQLTLGARSFDGKVPWRSRLGNVLTRFVFHFLVGHKLSDTQTGLRAIPAGYLPVLLTMDGNGYEFEMNMLLCAKQHGVPLSQEPVGTIYLQGNRSSHFNPVFDSLKIYFVLARFTLSSLFAALLDLAVFSLGYKFVTTNILANMVAGRAVSGTFNFGMNKGLVFHDKNRIIPEISKYLLLTLALMSLSYVAIQALVARFAVNPMAAKVVVETILFFGSFAIQRDFIFTKTPRGEGE